ncbi:MAG: DUF1501 domain-containing protein [Methylohalobius sp.]|nr:DUF1501 domain-containing protein [Methylohalobius sp.]
MRRRTFLTSLAVLSGAALLSPRWALGQSGPAQKTLIVLFLRGGNDGLNTLVPYAEPRYYQLRPTLAIPPPGRPSGAIALDGRFGLHPALAPLKNLYDLGEVALFPAVHYPNGNLSHFESQKFIESGDVVARKQGWLNRYLSATASAAGNRPWRAVAVGAELPFALQGQFPASVIASGEGQKFWGGWYYKVNPLPGWWREAYAGRTDPLGKRLAQAVGQGLDDVQRLESLPPTSGTYPDTNFGKSLKRLAQLIRSDLRPEIIALDLGGFDTHARQAQTHAGVLSDLATGLAAFYTDLFDLRHSLLLLVMSEFGRTVRENGSAGTDHGMAGLWLALGGRVRGGIWGDWPGLADNRLIAGNYLAPTVDFRDLLSEALARYLGADPSTVLPGYASRLLGFLA